MKDWIVETLMYFTSDWLNLLVGGLVVTSVVIFVLGLLKGFLINKIKNKLVRKVILAWLSVILVLPATAISIWYNGYSIDNYWGIYLINCLTTIFVYWFYENSAVRDTLALIGKKIVLGFVKTQDSSKNKHVLEEANKEIKSLLVKHVYKDDDLNNV